MEPPLTLEQLEAAIDAAEHSLLPLQQGLEVVVVEARHLADAQAVIQAVRRGQAVVLQVGGMSETRGRRLVDFVGGGINAMDGQMHRVGPGVFVVGPALTRVERG
jgi:FtsZ-interacting cell division protein YlmF